MEAVLDGLGDETLVLELRSHLVGVVGQTELAEHRVVVFDVDHRVVAVVLALGVSTHLEAQVQGGLFNVKALRFGADVRLLLLRVDEVVEASRELLHLAERDGLLGVKEQRSRDQAVHRDRLLTLLHLVKVTRQL